MNIVTSQLTETKITTVGVHPNKKTGTLEVKINIIGMGLDLKWFKVELDGRDPNEVVKEWEKNMGKVGTLTTLDEISTSSSANSTFVNTSFKPMLALSFVPDTQKK